MCPVGGKVFRVFTRAINANVPPPFLPAPRISQEHEENDWQLIHPHQRLT